MHCGTIDGNPTRTRWSDESKQRAVGHMFPRKSSFSNVVSRQWFEGVAVICGLRSGIRIASGLRSQGSLVSAADCGRLVEG